MFWGKVWQKVALQRLTCSAPSAGPACSDDTERSTWPEPPQSPADTWGGSAGGRGGGGRVRITQRKQKLWSGLVKVQTLIWISSFLLENCPIWIKPIHQSRAGQRSSRVSLATQQQVEGVNTFSLRLGWRHLVLKSGESNWFSFRSHPDPEWPQRSKTVRKFQIYQIKTF